jgi:hypothetical protein
VQVLILKIVKKLLVALLLNPILVNAPQTKQDFLNDETKN